MGIFVKKMYSEGFMLVETLIVTTFVTSVLIFLFIQFNNLSNNYSDSYSYNTVNDLYALRNVKYYIESDSTFINSLNEINKSIYIDMTDCNLVEDENYCFKLLEYLNIKKLYIVDNFFDIRLFDKTNEPLKKFVQKIKSQGLEKYRIIGEFNDSTYATIRFGD